MSWTVAQGSDSGAQVVVCIDEAFRDSAARKDLATRVSVRFLGSHMLRLENRDEFERSMQPFLAAHGGVLVAGITRTKPVSYTFHFYCRSQGITSVNLPIGEELKRICTVVVHHDPEWNEYQSWLPEKSGILQRLVGVLGLFRAKLG